MAITFNANVPIAQYELKDPPTDVVAAVQFATASYKLLVASWDKFLYLYDTTQAGGKLLSKHEHRAPILDTCFGESDDVAYTAGLDWDVKRYVMGSTAATVNVVQ